MIRLERQKGAFNRQEKGAPITFNVPKALEKNGFAMDEECMEYDDFYFTVCRKREERSC